MLQKVIKILIVIIVLLFACLASNSGKGADWKSYLAFQNAYIHEGFPVQIDPSMGGGGYGNPDRMAFDLYGLTLAKISQISKIDLWLLTIHLLPFIYVLLSIYFFYRFYLIISDDKKIALWSLIGLLIFIVISLEQRGERIGAYYLQRIAEDKGFLWLVGTPLFGWLSLYSIQKRKWLIYVLLFFVTTYLSLVHPLSIFWLSPIFAFAIFPFYCLRVQKYSIIPVILCFIGILVGAGAAFYQAKIIASSYTANFNTISEFGVEVMERRNILLIFSDVSYIIHPRLISDRFVLLCFALIPFIVLKYKKKEPLFIYAIGTTVVFIVILFIPFMASFLAKFICYTKLDRMLWNIPFPLIFGMGVTCVEKMIRKLFERYQISYRKQFSIFAMILIISLGYFTRSTTYYRLRKNITRPQQITKIEREVYKFINTLNLPIGTRIWAPGKINQYLPAFCYGIYPYEFRGRFDTTLEIPDGMDIRGGNSPVALFYSKIEDNEISDIDVQPEKLLQNYKPDWIIFSGKTEKSVLDNFINNKIITNYSYFKNTKYVLYKIII